jgi:hypothetical protein
MNFENHPHKLVGFGHNFQYPPQQWLTLVTFLGANFVVFGEKQIGEFLDKRVFLI